jgi:hypothetical protein
MATPVAIFLYFCKRYRSLDAIMTNELSDYILTLQDR